MRAMPPTHNSGPFPVSTSRYRFAAGVVLVFGQSACDVDKSQAKTEDCVPREVVQAALEDVVTESRKANRKVCVTLELGSNPATEQLIASIPDVVPSERCKAPTEDVRVGTDDHGVPAVFVTLRRPGRQMCFGAAEGSVELSILTRFNEGHLEHVAFQRAPEEPWRLSARKVQAVY